MALSSNKNSLIAPRLETVLTQKAARKVPEWATYCKFGKVTLNPHFLKKWRRGTKGNFSKIAQKVALA